MIPTRKLLSDLLLWSPVTSLLYEMGNGLKCVTHSAPTWEGTKPTRSVPGERELPKAVTRSVKS